MDTTTLGRAPASLVSFPPHGARRSLQILHQSGLSEGPRGSASPEESGSGRGSAAMLPPDRFLLHPPGRRPAGRGPTRLGHTQPLPPQPPAPPFFLKKLIISKAPCVAQSNAGPLPARPSGRTGAQRAGCRYEEPGTLAGPRAGPEGAPRRPVGEDASVLRGRRRAATSVMESPKRTTRGQSSSRPRAPASASAMAAAGRPPALGRRKGRRKGRGRKPHRSLCGGKRDGCGSREAAL